jgi:hypothetical protein
LTLLVLVNAKLWINHKPLVYIHQGALNQSFYLVDVGNAVRASTRAACTMTLESGEGRWNGHHGFKTGSMG